MERSKLEHFISAAKDRWASYEQMKEINPELIDTLVAEAQHHCYDAVNLMFELGSSTSGMYGKWFVRISPICTVYLDRPLFTGIAGTFNGAVADFILQSMDWREKNPEQPVPTSGE